ncbi:MAG: hypothetical protein HYV29_01595, partial [Ignavibacteriales bacterium]|nr:hypothetical protein [Ignavibacteriales bacterium]
MLETRSYSVATKEFLEEIGRMNIGNKIQLTMPYWADLETNSIDDETLITFLDDLVNKYIRVSEGPKIISEKTTYLKTTLREEFQRRKYLSPNNTFKKHKIVTNYQTAKFDWYYDFALKNRRLHLFETLDLTKRSIESAID